MVPLVLGTPQIGGPKDGHKNVLSLMLGIPRKGTPNFGETLAGFRQMQGFVQDACVHTHAHTPIMMGIYMYICMYTWVLGAEMSQQLVISRLFIPVAKDYGAFARTRSVK